MFICRNSQGRVRLIWKLIGIILITFILTIFASALFGILLALLGFEPLEAYIIGNRFSLWFSQLSMLMATLFLPFKVLRSLLFGEAVASFAIE